MNLWDDPQAGAEELRRQGFSDDVVTAFEGAYCAPQEEPEPEEEDASMDPALQRIMDRCEELARDAADNPRPNIPRGMGRTS